MVAGAAAPAAAVPAAAAEEAAPGPEVEAAHQKGFQTCSQRDCLNRFASFTLLLPDAESERGWATMLAKWSRRRAQEKQSDNTVQWHTARLQGHSQADFAPEDRGPEEFPVGLWVSAFTDTTPNAFGRAVRRFVDSYGEEDMKERMKEGLRVVPAYLGHGRSHRPPEGPDDWAYLAHALIYWQGRHVYRPVPRTPRPPPTLQHDCRGAPVPAPAGPAGSTPAVAPTPPSTDGPPSAGDGGHRPLSGAPSARAPLQDALWKKRLLADAAGRYGRYLSPACVFAGGKRALAECGKPWQAVLGDKLGKDTEGAGAKFHESSD